MLAIQVLGLLIVVLGVVVLAALLVIAALRLVEDQADPKPMRCLLRWADA